MTDDFAEGINFWPAFTDFMLALVLVLLLVLGAADLERIERAQNCEKTFASEIPNVRREGTSYVWHVRGNPNSDPLITIQRDDQDKLLLRVTFSDSVLGFGDCDDRLGNGAGVYLQQIADEILKQSNSIVEIQILGHADNRATNGCKRFPDNLHLASARADTVFEALQARRISPVEHAMSAVSYGEFFPTARSMGKPYTEELLKQANATGAEKQANRRVELILRYGAGMQGCELKK